MKRGTREVGGGGGVSGGLGNQEWSCRPMSRSTPSANSARLAGWLRGEISWKFVKSRMGGPSGEPSQSTPSSQDLARLKSRLVGLPVQTNCTRIVLPVGIELLSEAVEHTGKFLVVAMELLHLPMTCGNNTLHSQLFGKHKAPVGLLTHIWDGHARNRDEGEGGTLGREDHGVLETFRDMASRHSSDE